MGTEENRIAVGEIRPVANDIAHPIMLRIVPVTYDEFVVMYPELTLRTNLPFAADSKSFPVYARCHEICGSSSFFSIGTFRISAPTDAEALSSGACQVEAMRSCYSLWVLQNSGPSIEHILIPFYKFQY